MPESPEPRRGARDCGQSRSSGVYEPTWFGAVARRAIHWTRGVLEPEHAARLRTLDVFGWLDERTCIVHAALHPEPNERYHLSVPERVRASFAKLRSGEIPARVCFFGHTHQVVVHRSDAHAVARVPVESSPARVELDDGYYLVNPGSVGQSRDADPRAAFAIFDSDANSVEFHRVEYDVDACLRKAADAGLLAPRALGWRSLLSRFRPR
jgi:diadenosine tetraphosphatase ApaH/serine/threonine PP2A family protein phosphatase